MYIIDTHVLIWSFTASEKLSQRVKHILSSTSEVYISVISLWEVALKFGIGKLVLEGGTPEILWQEIVKSRLKVLPLHPETAIQFHNLPLMKHQDPFDRLIIWQALQNNFALISKDKDFEEYRKTGLQLIW